MGKSLDFAILGCIFIAGCTSTPAPDYDFVQKQWTSSVARLGQDLYPVYPPTEDIQIGDVYAIEVPDAIAAGTDKTKLRTLRLGYVPEMNDYLSRYYSHRIQFPKTHFSADDKSVNRSVDQGDKGRSAFGGRFKEQLPISAFPEYTIASGRVFDFAASFPGKVFGFLFGYVGSESTDLKVSVSDNSTVGIPAYDAQRLLGGFCGRKDQPCNADRMMAAYVATYGVKPRYPLMIRLISRVHLTRTINFTYVFRSATAMKAVAARLDSMKIYAEKAAALVTPPITPADDPKTATNESVDSARGVLLKQMIDSLNQDISALAGAQGEGFAFSSGSYNGRSVVLSQSFPRPLTFAYGGVWWDGRDITRVAVERSATPSVSPALPPNDLPPVTPQIVAPKYPVD